LFVFYVKKSTKSKINTTKDKGSFKKARGEFIYFGRLLFYISKSFKRCYVRIKYSLNTTATNSETNRKTIQNYLSVLFCLKLLLIYPLI